jgi:ABC-type multidrug transport system fused ATPase/permease subunit
MHGLAVPFIVRRMGASRLLLGCILLTTAITAALITALTSFWVQALGQAADGQLARSGAMSIVISGQVNAHIAAAGGRAVRATMHTVFGNIRASLQQRVAIARALAARPRLLIADEPTGQLDSETGRQIMRLLRTVVQSEGITALVATHDAELTELADDVLTLEDGRLLVT